MRQRFTVVPDPQGYLNEWTGRPGDLPIGRYMLASDLPDLDWKLGEVRLIPVARPKAGWNEAMSEWDHIHVRAKILELEGYAAKVRVWHRID